MKKMSFKILIIIFFCLVFAGILRLVFHKDMGYDTEIKRNEKPLISEFVNIPKEKNVTLYGVDYLQSQLPLGVFGGTFTTSIMGEPKTFNPYNANDATSAELSEIMYDGLTKTDSSTGSVVI